TIDRQVLSLRQRRYETFRGGPIERVPIQAEVRFDPFEVEVRSKAHKKSLAELGIRENSGATIVAARRSADVIANPPSNHVLHERRSCLPHRNGRRDSPRHAAALGDPREHVDHDSYRSLASMTTIQMTLEEDLLKEMDRTVKKLGTTRSALIRDSIRQYLKTIHMRQLEAKHRAGYT